MTKLKKRCEALRNVILAVEEVYSDRAKLRVLVSFFGRETPVELDFLQVEHV